MYDTGIICYQIVLILSLCPLKAEKCNIVCAGCVSTVTGKFGTTREDVQSSLLTRWHSLQIIIKFYQFLYELLAKKGIEVVTTYNSVEIHRKTLLYRMFHGMVTLFVSGWTVHKYLQNIRDGEQVKCVHYQKEPEMCVRLVYS